MEPITRRETLLNQIADNTSGNAGSIDMEPITREEVYLKAIADNTASGGGGSDLPAVTSDDNGDVLTVVNGAWDKAAPSGGSDLPGTPAQDGTYTLTNTVSSGSGTLAWDSDPYPGWDAVIKIVENTDATTIRSYNIVKGSFADVAEKVQNGIFVGVLVWLVFTEEGGATFEEQIAPACVSVPDSSAVSVVALYVGVSNNQYFWSPSGISFDMPNA